MALFTSPILSRHMYAGAHSVKHGDYARRCLGHKLGHLAPTATIGILLDYFISKLIIKSTGKSFYYILLIMFRMFWICYVCL